VPLTRVIRVAAADVGVPVLGALAAVEILVTLAADPGELGSPLGGLLVPWSLLSCLAPLALATIWWGPMSDVERTSARGAIVPTLIRLGVAGAIVGLATLVVSVAAPPDASPVAGDGLAAWRNAAFVTGVTVASAAWLPPTVAWFPATAYVVACAAVGVPTSGEPYAWMVIAQPPDDVVAAALGAIVLVAGVGAAMLTLRRR
jgi:hypothetical protein